MKLILPAITLAIALLSPCVPTIAAPASPTAPAPAPRLLPILANANSFSVTIAVSHLDTDGKMTLFEKSMMQFQHSDKYYVDTLVKVRDGRVHAFAVSDGRHRYLYLPTEAQYLKVSANSDRIVDSRLQMEMLPLGKPIRTMLDGQSALLFQQLRPLSGKPNHVLKTWLDAKTHLPLRITQTDLSGKQPKVIEQIVFTDWKINPVIPAAQFAFVPPAGAKEVVASAPPAEPALLANGTVAPDFAVQDPAGKPLHLSDYKGKVVVLDFWATWCGPCQRSLPHTQTVAAQFAPQGVVVLAVSVWDKREAFAQWLPQHAAFHNIAFAFDPSPGSKDVTNAYHVSGIPTQYVVGKDGKITQSFVGFGGPTDDLAHAVTLALKGSL